MKEEDFLKLPNRLRARLLGVSEQASYNYKARGVPASYKSFVNAIQYHDIEAAFKKIMFEDFKVLQGDNNG